jgi:cell division septum initiation protein DivIVA
MERRAETMRVESERHAHELIDAAKAQAKKARDEANAEAQRLVRDAKAEAERTSGAAKRELDDLTRQQETVKAQLGQLFQGLAGFAPASEEIKTAKAAKSPS